MKKSLIRFLNKCGLYTRDQYRSQQKLYNDLRVKQTVAVIYTNQLKKAIANIPFEFDALIGKYSKDQLNAFAYKLINHVRNRNEYRDLLGIWQTRIINALESLKPENTKNGTNSTS